MIGRLGALARGVFRRRAAGPHETPLLPATSVAGRSLLIVIAIMTFLAGLAAGTVEIMASASDAWRKEVGREVTIQLRPRPGQDMEADLARVAALARAIPGVERADVLPIAESARLLEPWIGAGLDLAELPLPRLVTVATARDRPPDLAPLRAALAREVPAAALDDHRLWSARIAAMTGAMVVAGLAILALVLLATALAIAFATQGAMAGNRHIIEVMNLVGASDRFIAREFQSHFLKVGLKGGAIGATAAVLTFVAAAVFSAQWRRTPAGDQIEALFGGVALGPAGYAAVAGIAVVVAALTALVSRATALHQLGEPT